MDFNQDLFSIFFFEDYRRVLSSLSFRGQNNKTQVFTFDREGTTRSRLSHSYEVAVNASKIFTEFLFRHGVTKTEKDNSLKVEREYRFTESLRFSLMTACLLHDVGNPPFGHTGEAVIRKWFSNTSHSENLKELTENQIADLQTFEGNANSLRIALKSSCMYDGRRLNLTATTIAALVKYPYQVIDDGQTKEQARQKFNYFEADFDDLEGYMARCGKEMEKLVQGYRHPLSFFLEAADDISYVTSDFEDAFRKGNFSVTDVVDLLLDSLQREYDDSISSNKSQLLTAPSAPVRCTYTLVCLLALIAGDESDKLKCVEFKAQNAEYSCPWIFLKELPTDKYGFSPKEGYCDFLLSTRNDAKEEYSHTFQAAIRELFGDQKPTADELHQLQETYVGRWVDIVRDWLCFSSAASLMGSLKELVKQEFGHGVEAEIDEKLFGNHLITIRALKRVMEYFVYDSRDNLFKNAHAETILGGLLDYFIPPAIECAKQEINPVTLSRSKDSSNLEEEANGCLDQTQATRIRLIPLRYRMDCWNQLCRMNKQGKKQYYLYIMMVLDYISGLSDEEAAHIYSRILG